MRTPVPTPSSTMSLLLCRSPPSRIMAPVSERELGKRAPTVLGFFKNILKKWMFSLIQARRVSRGWLGILGQQFLGGVRPED